MKAHGRWILFQTHSSVSMYHAMMALLFQVYIDLLTMRQSDAFLTASGGTLIDMGVLTVVTSREPRQEAKRLCRIYTYNI